MDYGNALQVTNGMDFGLWWLSINTANSKLSEPEAPKICPTFKLLVVKIRDLLQNTFSVSTESRKTYKIIYIAKMLSNRQNNPTKRA
ncbi:hypothetical protein Musp01_11050 [Muricauda sp. NBRC 101325]|nr:hypothetical protein Musp01_11050 [Muricauda sp. NBRC 101325]